jgi:hypothetical protein
MQRLAALETAIAELSQRIDTHGAMLASYGTRQEAQREKLQRVLLDGEGARRDVVELSNRFGQALEDARQSFQEIRSELQTAAYVALVPREGAPYVIRESAATMVKRVADAVGVELVAAPPINKPGMIHARSKAPEGVQTAVIEAAQMRNRLWLR